MNKNLLIHLLFFTSVVLLSLNSNYAQEDFNKVINVDLDKDGVKENIFLKKHRTDDNGSYYHLVVYQKIKNKRKILWEDKNIEYEFCYADWGIEELQIAGDIDKDGKIELVTNYAISDVSPVSFRIFRWTGDKFIKSDDACYIIKLKDGNTDGEIFTSDTAYSSGEKDFTSTAWIDEFTQFIEPDFLEVNITGYDSEDNVLMGKAILQSTDKGFKLVKWLEELHD
ncbi:MAG: hypothetical protein EPN82_07990 [Bacteroidetes bacterium]|nr:MAG: hypothetical protein EPN82_07990 [Bacteroidota bacterium]